MIKIPQRQLTTDEEREAAHRAYSKWHRFPTLPRNCYMIDGDWIELRSIYGNLIPVALIETISYRGADLHKAHEEKALTPAKQALGEYIEKQWLPTYIVWFDPGLLSTYPEVTNFLVMRMGQDPILMSEETYKSFLIKLHITYKDYRPYPENALWPIIVETVHKLPVYPTHRAYVRDYIFREEPDISAEKLSFNLGISLGEAMVILHELDFEASSLRNDEVNNHD